jgi:phosphatidylinositol-3,4,5-trisphosphate 3-phosphatase/dual-specificity protein phosphatase PTEN
MFGWFWFIPAFHMAEDAPAPTTLTLGRKEVDFPLGLGKALVDVAVELEWRP